MVKNAENGAQLTERMKCRKGREVAITAICISAQHKTQKTTQKPSTIGDLRQHRLRLLWLDGVGDVVEGSARVCCIAAAGRGRVDVVRWCGVQVLCEVIGEKHISEEVILSKRRRCCIKAQ